MIDRRYPLHWPDGWKRSSRRVRSRYDIAFGRSTEGRELEFLLDELRKLGAQGAVISTNIQLKSNGFPYVNQRVEDPGVALYWTENGQEYSLACDCWATIGENYHALALTIMSLRQIKRCGASEILDRSYRGFTALPPAQSHKPEWRKVLGFSDGKVRPEEVRARYKELVKTAHPDRGGTEAGFIALQQALTEALKEMGAWELE